MLDTCPLRQHALERQQPPALTMLSPLPARELAFEWPHAHVLACACARTAILLSHTRALALQQQDQGDSASARSVRGQRQQDAARATSAGRLPRRMPGEVRTQQLRRTDGGRGRCCASSARPAWEMGTLQSGGTAEGLAGTAQQGSRLRQVRERAAAAATAPRLAPLQGLNRPRHSPNAARWAAASRTASRLRAPAVLSA